MRFPNNLAQWLPRLLPGVGACAQQAALTVVQALLVSYRTTLADVARQSHRCGTVKSRRQWLSRWLSRPHWQPEALYAQLNRQARRLLARRGDVALLVDFTDLGSTWRVLQVSVAWRGRAVVLYRSVVHYTAPEIGQREQVRQACAWLWQHLPGRRGRYVLVMDRGFPSHRLVRELTETGFRFVLRAQGEWKLTHPDYTGQLKHAPRQPGLVGPRPRCLSEAVLGCRGKGRAYWSRAHVVFYHGEGAKEPWYLLTSETRAARAVALYRRRMGIEAEFRDLKGPFGLEQLAAWQDRERVERFLALVAIYEWWLVYLWLKHRLRHWAPFLALKGTLSWIQITRLWIQQQLQPFTRLALACL